MKKVIKIIGMMCMGAVLVLGASSCKKDKTEKVSSFDISLPAIEGESGISDDSKAYIDLTDNMMKWYDGDYVMMYSIDSNYTKSQAYPFIGEGSITGATQAHFSGIQMVEGSEGFFAFYPASKASTEIKHDNRVTFNVGEMQTYETDLYAGTAYEGRIFMDPRCVVAAATCDIVDNSAAFSLKHIFGYFNVRIKNGDSKNLKSVTITDSKLHLTGSMSVEIPALKSADLDAMKGYGLDYRNNVINANAYWAGITEKLQEVGYIGNGTGYSVTLDCSAANGGKGAPITNKNKYFLMALRPGALMNDFTITLEFKDGDTTTTETYEVGANRQYISVPGSLTVISINRALDNGGLPKPEEP